MELLASRQKWPRHARAGGFKDMKSLGARAEGARLDRMRASPAWSVDRFRNVHPIMPGLRDPTVPMPTFKEFIRGGERRVPTRALP
jgi:hypothetical protein